MEKRKEEPVEQGENVFGNAPSGINWSAVKTEIDKL